MSSEKATSGDDDFQIHSVLEPEEEPDAFLAYVVIADDQPTQGPFQWEGPALEAEVIRAAPAPMIPRGRSIRYSLFAEQRTTPAGEMDLLLTGPGGGLTELRLSPETQSYLAEDATFLLEPDLLGQVGGGIRLHGIPIEFVPDPAQESWTGSIWLPIARIHRPNFRGCHARYTVLDTQDTTYNVDFGFSGFGMKGDLKFSADFKRTYPAESSCKEACVQAKISIIWGTTRVGDRPLSYGTRIKVWGVEPERRAYRDIPPPDDHCGWPEAKAPTQGRTFEDLTGATGESGDAPDDEVTIGTEVAGTVSIGVEFGGNPVTLSMGYSRRCAHKTALQTTYMPGASYLGYRPRIDNPMEKCWTVLGA